MKKYILNLCFKDFYAHVFNFVKFFLVYKSKNNYKNIKLYQVSII